MAEGPVFDDADADALVPAERISARATHLRTLASTVEQDDPVLACELRGIAQHESSLGLPPPRRPLGIWKRLLRRRSAAPAWR